MIHLLMPLSVRASTASPCLYSAYRLAKGMRESKVHRAGLPFRCLYSTGFAPKGPSESKVGGGYPSE